ncbi:MAG: FHA domain-containing protein, partial [bacterium]
MPLLNSGTESCALPTGTYTIGGHGPDALPLPSLEWRSPVATITVAPSGPSMIQRLTASVVVRLDEVTLGVAPQKLKDGAIIEFETCRLTFTSDDAGVAMITAASNRAHSGRIAVTARPAESLRSSTVHARIVNMSTGDAIELGNTRVVVGRDASADFVLAGMGVSRRHFSVTPVLGGYLLRDESANGTVINGSRICGTYLLGHGDILRLDDEELRFEEIGVAPREPDSADAPTAILDLSRIRREHA